jgi:acetyl-CoA C-acetyltransferase
MRRPYSQEELFMTDIVIVAAARTPIGSFNGSLSSYSAAGLGEIVIRAVLRRADLAGSQLSEVILGQVLSAGAGQNPARQASINAGVPKEVPAWGVNQLCASGLRSVALGYQAILEDNSAIVLAGGQESMTNAPHCVHLRAGVKIGSAELGDSMLTDGLTDHFNGYHMGITAENVARQWGISREEQDEFAAASQQKAEAATKAGRLASEIVPVDIVVKKERRQLDTDEGVRFGTTAETLSRLRPAFDKEGTVTAGNASGINDGASAVILMSAAEAARRGITPLARIVAWAQAGVDPAIMGTGPIPAVRAVLKKSGWSVDDLDLIEGNEAFAAQAIAVNRELGWDTAKVNVNGGAIALGHPIGASGNRILVALLHEMGRRDAKKGLATLCVGGGMGVAVTVER